MDIKNDNNTPLVTIKATASQWFKQYISS